MAKNLKKERKRLGVLTTMEVARQTGVPWGTIIGWVRRGIVAPGGPGGRGGGKGYWWTANDVQVVRELALARNRRVTDPFVKQVFDNMKEVPGDGRRKIDTFADSLIRTCNDYNKRLKASRPPCDDDL